MKKTAALLVLAAMIPVLTSCCVSRKSYDENIGILQHQINKQKIEIAAEKRSLELKVQERGRTLGDLTALYMDVKGQNDFAQAKLNRLQKDLETLLRDTSEIKLVIFSNFKGAEANEMLFKLNDMQKRVQELLKKSSEPMPAPAPAAKPGAKPDAEGKL